MSESPPPAPARPDLSLLERVLESNGGGGVHVDADGVIARAKPPAAR